MGRWGWPHDEASFFPADLPSASLSMVGPSTLQGHTGSDPQQIASGLNVPGLDQKRSQSRWGLGLRLGSRPSSLGRLSWLPALGQSCPSGLCFSGHPLCPASPPVPLTGAGGTDAQPSELRVTSSVNIQCHLPLFSYKVHLLDF